MKEAEKEAAKAAKEAEKEAATVDDIVVGDPLILRPVELPLVVKPSGEINPADPLGGWATKAQFEFAKILNSYAYQNPEKWEKKKVVINAKGVDVGLIAQLRAKALVKDVPVNPDAPRLSVGTKRS